MLNNLKIKNAYAFYYCGQCFSNWNYIDKYPLVLICQNIDIEFKKSTKNS